MHLPRQSLPKAVGNRFELRNLTVADFDPLRDLQERCFPGMLPWSQENILKQVATFAEGQLCIEHEGKIVASSSSLMVNFQDLPGVHTWAQACDHGSIGNHNPHGDALYGIEIMVDPEFRGQKLSRKLYDARKALVKRKNLRRILIGGRIPGYHKWANQLSVDAFVNGVVGGRLSDPTLLAQMANGFRVLGALPDYFLSDWESCGHAVYLEWLNPDYRAQLTKVAPTPTSLASSPL